MTGRLLFHDQTLVERVEPDGSLLALVGRGEPQDATTADGTLASNLQIDILRGMAQDAAGNLYLADAAAGRVYRVVGWQGIHLRRRRDKPVLSDGGPATAAQLASPRGMVFDSKGNLDIAETLCDCIRQVSPAGIISTVYTLSSSSGTGLRQVEGLAIDAQDNLYLTEWLGHTVLKIAANGTVTTIAGTGAAGFSGDGGPATAAQLYGPSAVAIASDGAVYIADSGNNRVRKVAPDGTISTIAGTGPGIANILLPPSFQTCAFSGDGGPATSAQLCDPAQLAFDKAGGLYVADFGNARVRRISPDGIIATVAGSGQPVPLGQSGGALSYSPANPFSSGDGGPAIHATFNRVGGAIFDAAGNLYVSDSGGNRIRKIAPDGTIAHYAGTGQAGYSGDGGPASQAALFGAGPLAMDPKGDLYVITGDSRVRKITPDGTIHLVAGTGTGTGLIARRATAVRRSTRRSMSPAAWPSTRRQHLHRRYFQCPLAEDRYQRHHYHDRRSRTTGHRLLQRGRGRPSGKRLFGVDSCRPIPRGCHQCGLGNGPPGEPRRIPDPVVGNGQPCHGRTGGHAVRLRRRAAPPTLSCARFGQ